METRLWKTDCWRNSAGLAGFVEGNGQSTFWVRTLREFLAKEEYTYNGVNAKEVHSPAWFLGEGVPLWETNSLKHLTVLMPLKWRRIRLANLGNPVWREISNSCQEIGGTHQILAVGIKQNPLVGITVGVHFEKVQKRFTRMSPGLAGLIYGVRLDMLGFFSFGA